MRLLRFIAITTKHKRASLDDAKDLSVSNKLTLRQALRQFEKNLSSQIQNGFSIQGAGSNGHSSQAHPAGEASATPSEWLEMWRDLIDLHDRVDKFLAFCAKYGLDPTDPSVWLLDSTPLVAVPNPVPVTDDSRYAQMMCRLVPITSGMSDYWLLRAPFGPYQFA